ncbi:MAG: TolC family protein [Rhodothermaceae bacterium]|nr:TolC family protein [Rhodothermaceae bacterium]
MRKLILVLCLSLTTAISASAQEVEVITLEDAIQIALEKNITLLQAGNNLQRNDAEVLRATGDFLPNLNLSGGVSRTVGRQFNQATISFQEFTNNTINANLSGGVILFNGLQNINNLRAARSSRSSAQDEFQRARENVIFSTASSYLQVLLDKELISIAEENLEASARQLEQITAQVEVGMRPIVDQFNQEAIVANNELEVITRENSLNLNTTRLIAILQIDPLKDYDFVVPDVSDYDLKPNVYSLNELVQTALANRSDLSGQEFRIMAARYALSSARGNYLPTISLNASISTRYFDTYREPEIIGTNQQGQPVFTRVTVGFGDQFFDRGVNRQIGLNLNFPLFTRFQNRTFEQQRRIDLKSAELQLESLQSDVFLEGSSTLIELTQANSEFVRAASNRVQTVFRFIFQEKLLDFYLGQITEDVRL